MKIFLKKSNAVFGFAALALAITPLTTALAVCGPSYVSCFDVKDDQNADSLYKELFTDSGDKLMNSESGSPSRSFGVWTTRCKNSKETKKEFCNKAIAQPFFDAVGTGATNALSIRESDKKLNVSMRELEKQSVYSSHRESLACLVGEKKEGTTTGFFAIEFQGPWGTPALTPEKRLDICAQIAASMPKDSKDGDGALGKLGSSAKKPGKRGHSK